MNKLKPIFSILRGAVKSIPLGNIIIEGIENRKALKAFKASANVPDGIKMKVTGDGNEKPHDWISIAVQAIIVGSVVYAFFTKQITIDDLIKHLTF